MEAHALKVAEAQRKTLVYQNKEDIVLPGLPEGYVAPQQRVYEEEKSDLDSALEEQAENEELAAPVKKAVKEEVVEEAPKAVEPVKEEKVETVVKTTTTLEDLEKALAEDSSKSQKKSSYSKRKKKVEEEEKEEEKVEAYSEKDRMSIYTEEELKELEAE